MMNSDMEISSQKTKTKTKPFPKLLLAMVIHQRDGNPNYDRPYLVETQKQTKIVFIPHNYLLRLYLRQFISTTFSTVTCVYGIDQGSGWFQLRRDPQSLYLTAHSCHSPQQTHERLLLPGFSSFQTKTPDISYWFKNEDEASKNQFVALSNVLNANLFCYWGLEIERVLFRRKKARQKSEDTIKRMESKL